MKNKNIETTLVTAGRKKEWTSGIVNPPVYRASTILFDSYADLQQGIKSATELKLFYGRKGTPTHWALREAMCELEGSAAAGAMLYPSGLSAICSAILSIVKAGDHILITDSAYEPTRFFANGTLRKMGVETTYYDPLIGADIKTLIQENTTAVLVEAPGSLTFEVQDIPAIAKEAHKAGAFVIMDNTWATPLLYRAFDHGVDISVHAATKYICGHSDVMMGIAVANERAWPLVEKTSHEMGLTTGPDDAALVLRGLRTLGVRLKSHEENALLVASWLENHPMVERILHPAFESCPGHDIWQRDFLGSSGLFSITLKQGSYADSAALVDNMKYFKMGFSWGGYESLILPSNPSRVRTATKFKADGPLIRLHIGLENPEDLIKDLAAGLERYTAKVSNA